MNKSISLPFKSEKLLFIKLIIFLIACTPSIVKGQTQEDSVQMSTQHSQLINKSLVEINDLSTKFKHQTDSLNSIYQELCANKSSKQRRLKASIDSLSSLQLPTDNFQNEFDSLDNQLQAQAKELDQKFNTAKSETLSRLDSLVVPPEMQETLKNFQTSISDYIVPIPNGYSGPQSGTKLLESITGNALSFTNLPDDFSNINNSINKLNEISTQANQLKEETENITQGTLTSVKKISENVESEIIKQAGMDKVLVNASEAEIFKMKPDSAFIAREVNKILISEVTRGASAMNHFKGKEQVLIDAVEKMQSLKVKYKVVKDLTTTLKDKPNSLKMTPFIERLILGINFQAHNNSPFQLDVGLHAQYKISQRFMAGLGWYEQVTFQNWRVLEFRKRIQGIRALGQFNINRGVSLRLLPEFVYSQSLESYRSNPKIEEHSKSWTCTAYAGVKKDFKIGKRINGSTEALLNVFQAKTYNLQSDRIVMRFGFEFPMKLKK